MRSSTSLLLPSIFLFAACGGDPKVDEIKCPNGTVRAGNNCVTAPDSGVIGNPDATETQDDSGAHDDATVNPDEDGGMTVEDSGMMMIEDAGVEGAATLSATSIDFGRSVVGALQTRDVIVENTTGAPVNVNLGIISGAQGADFSVTASDPITPSGILLQPGARVTFVFSFTARGAGPRVGALAFELCENGCPATLTLAGEGILDAFDCAPGSLDFLQVSPNNCSTQVVTCTNTASSDQTIANAAIRVGSSAAYSVASADPLPLTVAAGASAAFDVLYCPTDFANDSGTLEITVVHPDPTRTTRAVILFGAGGGPELSCNTNINFGVIAVSQSAQRTITCQNTGNAEAVIMSSLFNPPSGEYAVIGSPAAIVPAGGTLDLIVAYAPLSAGVHNTTLEINNNDVDSPVISISVTGEAIVSNGCAISFGPASVDFGAISVGTSAASTVTFANSGTGSCSITVLGLSSGSAAEFSLVGAPSTVSLAPGDTFNVELAFSPVLQQTYSGALQVMTTDLLLPAPLSIPIAGTGLDASYPIIASPSPLDFGNVQPACSDPTLRFIRVSNVSNAAVSLAAAMEAGSSAAFTLGTPSPINIGAGNFVDLEVRFAPAAAGANAGRVRLTPNALPSIFVPLTGDGDAAAANVQTFLPRPTPRIDFLLVVDDSCSMAEEQTSLANTAATLIARADASGTDYHIAVTTTDPGDTPPWVAGQLRGAPAVISGASASRVTDLQAAINQGTAGSAFEQGLLTAVAAVTNPTLLSGANAGFLRPDADLVILLLSDEPDQSPDTVAFYVNALRTRVSGPLDSVRFYSISGGLNGCSGPGGVADAGIRYVEASNALGGFDRSICDASYTQSITDIADQAFDPARTVYQLNSPPAPGSIDVYVDNVLTLPSVGNTAVWGADYAEGRVVFAPGHAPDGTSTVRIEYDAFCVRTTCGNGGAPQAGEQCDDGNAINTDACPSTCYAASCGDGFVRTNVEQCDDANTIQGDGCNAACVVEGCGNNFVEPGEQCDNGPANSNTTPNACRTNCVAARCGDTVIDSGEQCDDANTSNTDACVACQTARCGDGFVRTGIEQCDDGNAINNDLCTNACMVNLGTFTITTVGNSPLVPTANGTPIVWTTNGDEDVVQQQIGFSFNYLGASVTSVSVVSNGYLAFETPSAATYTNVAIPNTAQPNAYLAWWYDDLDFGRIFTGVTTSASTTLTGNAPNRVRVFTFQNVGRYGPSSTDGTVVTAEVRLFETTNVIEVHYGTVTQTSATPSTFSATVGYETTGGLSGAHAIACGATCSTANWPTSTIYRYTP